LSKYKEEKINIFVDGASKGNPGPAGVGIVIKAAGGKSLRNISKYIGKTTNNVAEYTALNFALTEALISNFKNVSIKSDSELLVKQLNGKYKVKSNNIKNLYLQAEHLMRGFNQVKIDYIRRAENKQADKLANQAITQRK
jgi:ribonuclease HI